MIDRAGQQLGNYRLLRLLGRGGFADIYLGEHVYLKSLAALKILRLSLTDEERTAFLKEGQTLTQLAHPNIVRVLDFAVEDDQPYLVMDYAPNGSLRELYPSGSRLPLDSIIVYVSQVAAALRFCIPYGTPVQYKSYWAICCWNLALYGSRAVARTSTTGQRSICAGCGCLRVALRYISFPWNSHRSCHATPYNASSTST